jgi:hypothetical protein
VRQLGSKLLAGGLSAGLVLLWWPHFFPTDTVTSWLGRGVVWTLSFELLLIALSPFELALWTTEPGARLTQKVAAARGMLEHPSPRRMIGRRAAIAFVALAVPLTLIGAGLHAHIRVSHGRTPEVTSVTRVVRVVRPVEVRRVVRTRMVRQQVPVAVAQAPVQAKATPKTKAKPQRQKTVTPSQPKSDVRPVTTVGQPTPTPAPTTGTTGPAASDVQTSAG